MQHPMPFTFRHVGHEGIAGTARPRRGLRRLLQSVAAIGLAASAVALSTSGTTGCGSFCEGGFVRAVPGMAQGKCEGLCSPSLCANANNVCVDNRCELQCTSLLDCAAGQDCVPAKTDGADGGTVTICQSTTWAPIGSKCPFGSECAMLLACPDGSNCDYTQCGGKPCKPDPDACADVTRCALGTCPDGTSCTVQGCPQSECKPLSCLGDGSGDADAYCTLFDCKTNSDCPTGYWCRNVRQPQQICGGPKPDANACGTTTGECVTTTGTTLTQGPLCAMRNVCVQHTQCDPCTADLDCSLTPGLHCTQVGAGMACTADCTTDSDCSDGFACTSGACVPRSGSCSASTGTGTFCENCVEDSDCTSGLICSRPPYGEERVCALPLGKGASCPNDDDNECPVSPSKEHGKCMDGSVQSSAGDGIYLTCWYPYNVATGRFGCWQGNKGTGCYVDADCISKSCRGGDEVQMTPGTCN